MFDLDECQCEKQCAECEDCFVAKCQCECEVEVGLKDLPNENDMDDDDGNDDESDEMEEVEEKREKSIEVEELGINVGNEERLPEY